MAGPTRDKLAEALIEREQVDRGNRSSWESTWQSVQRFLLPDQGSFMEEVSPGVERNRDVLDSTGPRALELFASFLHTLLNNPAQQWFRLRIRDNAELSKKVEVKKWMEEVERLMLSEMSSQSANLYQHLHTIYIDLGAYGTAVLYVEFVNGQLRVRAFHLQDCIVRENEAGFVDSLDRQEFLNPRQAKQRWGDAAGKSIDEAMKSRASGSKSQKFRFLHCVFPVSDQDMNSLLPARVKNSGSAFASIWINTKDRVVIQAGTFEEFPYMAPRWMKARGEAYGRSPGIKVLPDVRMANRMKATIIRGAEKLVDPPLLLPDGGLMSPVRLHAGGLTFTEGNVEAKPLIPPGASRIEMGNQLLEQVQRAIEKGFFVELFQTQDSPVKTATQVLQEGDERNRAVSPMLIRTQAELFHPLVLRVYRVMERNLKLPEPPEDLRGAVLDVEYVSPLTGSQRQLEGLAVMRLFESLAPWAQVDPGVFDHFEPDQVVAVVHGATGAPAQILRTKAKVKEVQDARAKQQQQAEGFARGADAADSAAKIISATNKGKP